MNNSQSATRGAVLEELFTITRSTVYRAIARSRARAAP